MTTGYSLEQINLLTALGAEFGLQLGLADIRGVRTPYSARELSRAALRAAGWDVPSVG